MNSITNNKYLNGLKVGFRILKYSAGGTGKICIINIVSKRFRRKAFWGIWKLWIGILKLLL